MRVVGRRAECWLPHGRKEGKVGRPQSAQACSSALSQLKRRRGGVCVCVAGWLAASLHSYPPSPLPPTRCGDNGDSPRDWTQYTNTTATTEASDDGESGMSFVCDSLARATRHNQCPQLAGQIATIHHGRLLFLNTLTTPTSSLRNGTVHQK